MDTREDQNISKDHEKKTLKCADQAEILRSYQRDIDFISQLQEKLSNLLHDLKNYRTLSRYLISDIPARWIYFVFTSGMGNQTLGEEYTGIVQANLKNYSVPSLNARIISMILEYFGERTLLKGLDVLQRYVNDPCNQLTEQSVKLFNWILTTLQSIIPLLILIHKGFFYISGRYYSLGKRLTKIDYAKVYGSSSMDKVSWGLRLLGIITLMQTVLRIWQNESQQKNNEELIKLTETDVHKNCQLCTEAISTTATPCGHTFCWPCISNWLRNKPQCPFCRENVPPQRIVYLMNL
ncbi:peroxisome biogenesis factor 10-like [Vespula pensylvanica]|uniref:RING-type E3 ubiquitin transferase n=1 Tax=Vespula pensylvanica TaxID=30213 RepID=A0A834P0S6_VESPE|nr:peroxisome biogenesis factor 10-like [Vespula pensylvanica]XP_043670733.1 peroxisome biogenesis factor 10-like [Vespula pensylvanica]XP_043670734.1 peroxisome biogenesis factor 10-like [Vespula pensylvanica]XP_043670735.1 peroxisome biogenesis factor 10-like [Vespula pensylvanica]XP_043670736.1 peroxisome biogenesis factor 10-like [Vespula pensylvanica]XP_043670737.1 peroxisome biogenesis factor 10-like [Vespula pensylvanica]XP_043670738.1 peroxisome biogenesis factor 10-like [Vespula pens